jgi:1,4-alpha-glucan branching enzyme
MTKVKSQQKINRRKVTFSFESSDTKEVILMGDFNNWNPKKHPMKSDENGQTVVRESFLGTTPA